ncbi:MAG: glycoside hydrolase family 127 protein [Kiritimatiellae bacterium]|nr:glycoside hydrolase family 127 protein [Kiritimatiellia bacterium]
MKKCLAVLFACSAAAAFAEPNAVPAYGEVKLKGPMGERLETMIKNHVIATDTEYITAPFLEKTERHGWWQTEFWGKYMHAAVPFWTYTGDEGLKRKIDAGLANIIASQEPSGYIGNYPDELRCGEGWDVWGMKYTMMGLMHYYDGTGDKKALEACGRVCDYLIGQLGPEGKRGYHLYKSGNWAGYASSSVLEPVVWLYKRTKEQKWLDFATYLVKDMTEAEDGPRLLDLALKGVSVADRNNPEYGLKPDEKRGYVMKRNRSKAYEMMSCYQGLIEYYEVTGREELLKAAVASVDQIIRDEINLAGGSACSESWFHGATKQQFPYVRLQETCVVTTWMRLVEKLLTVTGDPKYADELERAFYNIYLASMNRDATEFAAYTPLNGYRYRGHHHCYMHTNCCNANGPRGFLAFLRAFLQANGDRAIMNFYASGKQKITLPKTGEPVIFETYTEYPKKGYVRIVNHTAKSSPFTLSLRVPAWCARATVKVNGQQVDAQSVKAGSYCNISRDWKIGDVVEADFELTLRVHELDHYVAFTRGPVLLARDSRFNDGPLDEVIRRGMVTKDRPPQYFLQVRSPSDDIWMTFSATIPLGSHHENPEGFNWPEIRFCDYASAGNLWQPSNSYRVWFPVEYNLGE